MYVPGTQTARYGAGVWRHIDSALLIPQTHGDTVSAGIMLISCVRMKKKDCACFRHAVAAVRKHEGRSVFP